jgi:hypothetical protein
MRWTASQSKGGFDRGGYCWDQENYPTVLFCVWLQLPLSSNCNYSAGKSMCNNSRLYTRDRHRPLGLFHKRAEESTNSGQARHQETKQRSNTPESIRTPPICPCSGTPVWCLPCMQARDEKNDDYVTSHFLILSPTLSQAWSDLLQHFRPGSPQDVFSAIA